MRLRWDVRGRRNWLLIVPRRPPLTDGPSGLRVLKVLQGAQRSLVMNGEPVTLPMEAFV